MAELKPDSKPGGIRKSGRPREFDADRVINDALALFWKNGFDPTSTRELEATLGINQSSLYNEFSSKRGLLEAALDRYEALTSTALLEPMNDCDSGIEAIEGFFTNLADWVTREGRHGCMLINMMAEDGSSTASVRHRTQRYRNRVKQALKHCLDNAMANGEITHGHSQHRANLLLGMVLGFNIAARGGAGKSELQSLLDAVDEQLKDWKTH